LNRLNCEFQPSSLFFHRGALLPQRRRQIRWSALENRFNLSQRKADKLQGDDLFQSGEIIFAVKPVACRRMTGRLQQPEPVVVMQCSDSDSGKFREFARLKQSFSALFHWQISEHIGCYTLTQRQGQEIFLRVARRQRTNASKEHAEVRGGRS
jgi:midasin (ATPase involved in ribosome maturation)